MPPSELSEAQMADVLSYVRQAWGNHAAPVSVIDVLRTR
jgi:mono/diheme cytochrome c family protein